MHMITWNQKRNRGIGFALGLAALVTLIWACGGGGGGGGSSPPPEDFDRRALLTSCTERVILPALRDFASNAGGLTNATAMLQSNPSGAAELDIARAIWRAAMATWQIAEVLQLGPAGSPTMVMGGQGIRDEIYSWPTVNPCRVDQEIVSEDYLDAGFFEDELVNTRGLAALEYLLFDNDTSNACAAAVDINANGSWQALVDSGDLPARRSAYAARAAADVERRAIELRDAWEPSGGDFAGQLSRAGLSGSQFATAQDAVNDLFAALFYVELDVKDRKLAIPAGISPDCETDTCPEQSESQFADASREHIIANLEAAEQVYLCGDASAVGFDDFLTELGAEALADEMQADIDAAQAAAEAIPGTLISALDQNPDSVRQAHDALKTFTDDLKSEFATVLNLEIPREGAGDND